MKSLPERIVSGGQTGAERAAMDFAIDRGIPHSGWCSNGRMAGDGPIAPRYRLQETPNRSYLQRTKWNLRDSDGTVAISIAATLSGGSKKTVFLAHKLGRPVLRLSRDGSPAAPEQALRSFIREHNIKVLNMAGPRGSKEPEGATFVRRVLDCASNPL